MSIKRLEGYVYLGAHSALSFDPVATHLKMPWKYHLPNLSLTSDTAQAAFHLVGEAAPFLLSRAKGYALMSLSHIGSQCYRMAYHDTTHDTTRWEKIKIGLELFSTLSPLLLVFSGIAPGYFIAAQVAVIGMDIFENIKELRTQTLSTEQSCDRIFPIVSHGLYLIALKRTGCFELLSPKGERFLLQGSPNGAAPQLLC